MPRLPLSADQKYYNAIINSSDNIDNLPSNNIVYLTSDNDKLSNISKRKFRLYKTIKIISKVLPFLRLFNNIQNIIKTVDDIKQIADFSYKITLTNSNNNIVKLIEIIDKKYLTNNYITVECVKMLQQKKNQLNLQNSDYYIEDKSNVDKPISEEEKHNIILSEYNNLDYKDYNQVYDFFTKDTVINILETDGIFSRKMCNKLYTQINSMPELSKKIAQKICDNNKYICKNNSSRWLETPILYQDFLLAKHQSGADINSWISNLKFDELIYFNIEAIKILCAKESLAKNSKIYLSSLFRDNISNIPINLNDRESYYDIMVSLASLGYGSITEIMNKPQFDEYIDICDEDDNDIVGDMINQLMHTLNPKRLADIDNDLLLKNYLTVLKCLQNGDIKTLEKLILTSKKLINPNFCKYENKHFLSLAMLKNIEFVKLWIDNFQDEIDFNIKDSNYHTPLYYAVTNYNFEGIKLLCHACDTIEFFNYDNYSQSPILLALRMENKNTWDTLIDAIATTKNYNDNFLQELMEAIIDENKQDYIEGLISKVGMKINNEILEYAVNNTASECLSYLLQVQNNCDLPSLLNYANNLIKESTDNNEQYYTDVNKCIDIIRQAINN